MKKKNIVENIQKFNLYVFLISLKLGCANYLAYGIEYIIEFSALYSLNSPVTKRACEALCTADPGCRGAAYQTSDQNCGLFDSGTSQEYSGCLACTAFAKQCPTGTADINTFIHRYQ